MSNQFSLFGLDKTKGLFDNPIQHLNLMDLDLNILIPFDNQKLNI